METNKKQQKIQATKDSNPKTSSLKSNASGGIERNREFLPAKSETFDKVQYLKEKLQPIQRFLERKFQDKHHQYLSMIYTAKINCYKKYQETMRKEILEKKIEQKSNKGKQYYECLQKVQDMVQINFKKLSTDCGVVNQQLQNCIDICSGKSRVDEEFIQCAEKSSNSCIQRYTNVTFRLYKNMYDVIVDNKQLQKDSDEVK